jgi:hypothetical protein
MADGSSLPTAGLIMFDLSSQSGVTELLLAVRKSDLSTDDKNDLRDLVLLFTNGGRDESTRIALEQKIAALGIKAQPKSTPPRKEPGIDRPVIGTYRTSPHFSVPPVVPVAPPPPIPANVPVSTQVIPTEPVVPHEEPPQVPVAIPSVVETIPVEVKVPNVAGQEEYLNRIREIKALVNQKVGNPVNLVDIDNAVGREYMSALLDAMKRINSGASADDAMRRLEAAVVSVFAVIEKNAAAPSPEVASAMQPMQQSIPVAPPPPAPEPVLDTPIAVSVPVRTYVQEPILADDVHSGEPVVPVPSYAAPQPQPSTPPVSQTVYPQKFSSLADVLVAPSTPVPASIAPQMQQGGMASPLSMQDPLSAPEVEDGLSQLLSEWSIFKKSGIFGTGPKGREHPLYKKMADLQIPLLLAGRFEGATQEVRQSLTDYMNGWRYEQGIIYERGETFEHYLRRVIRHILDLQKG